MADYSNWTHFDARFETDCTIESITLRSRDLYTIFQKRSHAWLAITLTYIHEPIAVIFGRNVSEKVSDQKMFYFSTWPN